MIQKKWVEKPYNKDTVRELARSLQIGEIYATLLTQRGIGTYEDARRFFLPDAGQLHDPGCMKDLDKAADRIDLAVRSGEKILVYGDYDVDGTSAVALMYSFLRDHGGNLGFYIPHRHLEGYGISMRGIDHASDNGYTLIIALDCGIKAHAQLARARALDIDVIVCDHHIPDAERFPPAFAVLNPKRADCDYQNKDLSGCGIGFKLISALARKWGQEAKSLSPYLQLTALSIAADIVPMTGENRILTRLGLQALESDPLPGLKALLFVSREGQQNVSRLCTEDLTYLLAPRINAAGRMGEAEEAVRLLIEQDYQVALEIAEKLHHANTSRRELDQDITTEALEMIRVEEVPRFATVVYRPHWHKGVIGIVASRLMETCYRPTIVLTRSGDLLTGSARSVKGFNISEALDGCGDLLENYGGHFYAAGMTMKPENLETFTKRFEAIVSSTIRSEHITPEIIIDSALRLSEIKPSFFNTLRRFEPFGPGNREPVFIASELRDTGGCRIIKAHHIKFDVMQEDSRPIAGIGFKMADKFEIITSGQPFDLCFHLTENFWKGRKSLQLRVLDVRPSACVQG